MKAASLREVLNSMRKASLEEEEGGDSGGGVYSCSLTTKKQYKLETLANHHKEQILE